MSAWVDWTTGTTTLNAACNCLCQRRASLSFNGVVEFLLFACWSAVHYLRVCHYLSVLQKQLLASHSLLISSLLFYLLARLLLCVDPLSAGVVLWPCEKTLKNIFQVKIGIYMLEVNIPDCHISPNVYPPWEKRHQSSCNHTILLQIILYPTFPLWIWILSSLSEW